MSPSALKTFTGTSLLPISKFEANDANRWVVVLAFPFRVPRRLCLSQQHISRRKAWVKRLRSFIKRFGSPNIIRLCFPYHCSPGTCAWEEVPRKMLPFPALVDSYTKCTKSTWHYHSVHVSLPQKLALLIVGFVISPSHSANAKYLRKPQGFLQILFMSFHMFVWDCVM